MIESSLDYDVPSGRLFELLVTVVDRGDMSLSNSSSLTVSVTDINDQDPIFDAILYSVQVHENLTMVLVIIARNFYYYTSTGCNYREQISLLSVLWIRMKALMMPSYIL